LKDDYLIAFDSTQQALRAELLLDYAGIDIDIRPTPKDITAACAMSIAFPAVYLEKALGIISAERVEFEGIYRYCEGKHVRMAFSDDR
jgi:hypothetical protein